MPRGPGCSDRKESTRSLHLRHGRSDIRAAPSVRRRYKKLPPAPAPALLTRPQVREFWWNSFFRVLDVRSSSTACCYGAINNDAPVTGGISVPQLNPLHLCYLYQCRKVPLPRRTFQYHHYRQFPAFSPCIRSSLPIFLLNEKPNW